MAHVNFIHEESREQKCFFHRAAYNMIQKIELLSSLLLVFLCQSDQTILRLQETLSVWWGGNAGYSALSRECHCMCSLNDQVQVI